MSLKVGHITYANCAPFFHYLRDCGFGGEIINGVPARLNQMIAAGELDICPSSSIEYAMHADDYLLVPGHSISSIGPVQSVLLFTDRPLVELGDVPISITGESATSVALLKVLLKEFIQLPEVECRKAPDLSPHQLENFYPALLIGDLALKARQQNYTDCAAIDLGELWYHYTGLPFVFALWIVKRAVVEKEPAAVAEFVSQLNCSREQAFASLAQLARQSPEREWMGEEGLVEYWKQVSYELDPLHVEGLRCFYLLLEKHGLIDEIPELSFLDTTL